LHIAKVEKYSGVAGLQPTPFSLDCNKRFN